MTFEEFAKFEATLLEEVVKMNSTKGLEYTDGVSRFSNFDDEARDVGVDRLKVGEIFLNKHMRAIKAYIRNGTIKSNESIRGRFVDAIKYLTLIAGMVEETTSKGVDLETSYEEAYMRNLRKKAIDKLLRRKEKETISEQDIINEMDKMAGGVFYKVDSEGNDTRK